MTRPEFLTRLLEATNEHDVDRIEACFSADYVNETPCHPARGFSGREQVRRNWTTILGAVPDLEADICDFVVDAPRIWSEWEMRGTRRDGAPHRMRGVMVFTVQDGLASRVRFFVEPVDEEPAEADESVARLTGGGAS